jgi:hypothetical protein
MSNAHVVYADEDLLIVLEWDCGVPYFHHHFYKWAPSVLKKMNKVFGEVVDKLTDEQYTELWSYYDKENSHLAKFCDYYGFVKVGETDTQIIVLKEL